MGVRRVLQALVCLVVSFLGPGLVAAAPNDDDDPIPGLIASYGPAGAARPLVVRIDPDFTWSWGRGAPDARVPADGFEARWVGQLLIQSPGAHRFFARTEGRVELQVGATMVLGPPATASDAIELPPGLVPIVAIYHHDQGEARLALDWEGPGFRREPVPARLLFHDRADTPPIDEFERGRGLADRLGCANCHAVLDLPAHPSIGPPLADAGRAIGPDWLASWLTNPAHRRPRTRMPGFGFTPAQVADLVAFLTSVGPNTRAAPLTNELRMALNVASPEEGRLLFRSVGCLGCHVRGGADDARPAGPDLADLGRKRTMEWVSADLVQPKGKSSGHRADLKLTPEEAAHLAAYLVSDPPPALAPLPLPPGDAARGRALADRARCASCHEVLGLKPRPVDHIIKPENAVNGCLDANSPTAPRFDLTDDDCRALRAFVSGLPSHPSPSSPETLARDALRRRNCLGCHARDGQGGADLGAQVTAYLGDDPALGGRKGTLTPPNLTAVGDKLRPEALAEAIRGAAPTARPWLSVRMPAFPFEPGEADAIAAFFRSHDRMQVEPDPPDPSSASKGDHATAAHLIGQRGFGCVSCHVLAGRVPPGGEPETLGPDLALAHRRMTRRYFDRWIANPQRIIAGTPMPQFLQPVAAFPGTLDDQLATIWQFLGNPKVGELAAFGTKSILQRQGDRALVVLDMVLLPDAPGTPYTPRGLAIGLVNGQSLLFDTDRLTWLAWWRGGFLSRTKSGRLWEWHPEGDLLWTAPARLAPLAFLNDKGTVILPTEVRERFGRFQELEFEGTGVALSYELQVSNVMVRVREGIQPRDDGWERTVEVNRVPEGLRPALVEWPPEKASFSWKVGKARVTLQPLETTPERATVPEQPAARVLGITASGEHSYRARVRLSVARGP